jgi:Zn-dependent protease
MNENTQMMIYQAASWIIPLVIAIVFHEVAHGLVARYYGDMTASDLGRLSLNPIRHVDPFGTILLPMLLAVSGAPIFGWAKPVPIVPSRLRNPHWNMILVAAAGPLSNLILAAVAATLFGLWLRISAGWGVEWIIPYWLFEIYRKFLMINIFLALFNMLPIPGFDGSKVLAGLLPSDMRLRFQALDRYAIAIMLLIFVINPIVAPQLNLIQRILIPPYDWLLNQFILLTSLIR